MVVFGQIAAPWIVPAAAPGFTDRPELVATTVALTRVIFVAMVFLALSVFLTGYLQAHERFAVPAFAPVLFNVTIIGGTLWLGPTLGIQGLAVAWIAGTAAQFAVQIPAALSAGFRFRVAFDWRHPALSELGRLALPAMLGLAVVEINAYVGRFFASMLPSAGPVNAVAVLDYAYEVIQAPIGFFAISIATAVFPLLARYVQERNRRALVDTFSQGLRATIFVTLPVMALFLAVPELFVRLLFERFAFTAEATRAVASAVAAYGVGIVPIAGYYVVTRTYYALHDMVTPVRVGVGMIALNATLDYALMRVWGHVGIAAASTIVVWINVAILALLLRRRVGSMDERRIAATLIRAGAAAAAAGAAAWYAARWAAAVAPGDALAGQLFHLAASGLAAAAFYLTMCRVLGVGELTMVAGLLRRRRGARNA
jgi:putative peptidoglycan lipid II flippase